jgi:hypothetical protein
LFAIAKSRIAEENSAAAFVVRDNCVPNFPGDMVRDLLEYCILGHGSLLMKLAANWRGVDLILTRSVSEGICQ